jgi:hypothetical protein
MSILEVIFIIAYFCNIEKLVKPVMNFNVRIQFE